MGTAKARGSLADRIAQAKARTNDAKQAWLDSEAALNEAKSRDPKEAEPYIRQAVDARERFYRLIGRTR